jgi:hypothetical protein
LAAIYKINVPSPDLLFNGCKVSGFIFSKQYKDSLIEHDSPDSVNKINSQFLRKKQHEEEGHFLVNGLQTLGETICAKMILEIVF